MILSSLLGYLVGPAIVAAGISIYANGRFDKARAKRDFLSKNFESAREVIEKATESGIDYFSTEQGERTLKQEAYVMMYEREVRRSVSYIQEQLGSSVSSSQDATTICLVNFLASLTGGSFQDTTAGPDIERTREIGFNGVALKLQLQQLRNDELNFQLDDDFFKRSLYVFRGVRRYLPDKRT